MKKRQLRAQNETNANPLSWIWWSSDLTELDWTAAGCRSELIESARHKKAPSLRD